MNSSTNAASSFLERESPAELTDADLLVATRLLVGRSNQVLAALLAHLAEIAARGIHRSRACSSLYTYCISRPPSLRGRSLSSRRCGSLGPPLSTPLHDAIARGELHLTGSLMLGPHLTEENLSEVLARAKHRTKRCAWWRIPACDWFACFHPLPDVPPRIEPLGPPLASGWFPGAPTWSEFVQSTCPGPRASPRRSTSRPGWRTMLKGRMDVGGSDTGGAESRSSGGGIRLTRPVEPPDSEPARLPSRNVTACSSPRSEEYVKLVEEGTSSRSPFGPPRARARRPLHLRAMRALVAELKPQKRMVTPRPRKRPDEHGSDCFPISRNVRASGEGSTSSVMNQHSEKKQARRCAGAEIHPRSPLGARCSNGGLSAALHVADVDSPASCRNETHRLELHHLVAFAQHGEIIVRVESHAPLSSTTTPRGCRGEDSR